MGRRTWMLCLAVCVFTPPLSAMPDLFGISFSNFQCQFDGGSSFIAMDTPGTFIDVYRNYVPPTGAGLLLPGFWNIGGTLEDVRITMTVTNITATSADGIGLFWLKDLDGDIVSGDISGTWTKKGDGGDFSGSLSNVTYLPVVDNTFDGHAGTSVSMAFPSVQPWSGSLYGPASGAWFMTSGVPDAFVTTGSLDSTIRGDMTYVPAPGALVLAIFGTTSVVGWRRRRSA